MYKKTFNAIITIILSIFISVSAWGHSGRTDSSGGHKDNKNASGLGSYHYHHGYGPHLHPNGICPYTVSVTPKNSTTPSSNTPSTSSNTTTKTPAPTPKVNSTYVISYNKKSLSLYDAVVEKDNKIYVPLIQVAKELGYNVEYDVKTNIVYINQVDVKLNKTSKAEEDYTIYFNNSKTDFKIYQINSAVYFDLEQINKILQCEATIDKNTKDIVLKW